MNHKFFKKIALLLLASISTQASAMQFFRSPLAMRPEAAGDTASSFITLFQIPGAATTLDNLGKALDYIGRDAVVDSLNNVSEAANNLVANGVTLHVGPHKIIPQIGFCTLGCVASLCGLAVITNTALQKDQTNTKNKYWIGSGMTALGIAALFTSYLFSR